MPKRTRAHQLEDISRNRLRDIFINLGWVVEDLNQDYGEDFLVRIFEKGKATHFSFYIQAKSTDNISTYLSKDKKQISYPIKSDHIEHWNRFWEPVVLTVWDSDTDITYWEIIQTFVEDNKRYNSTKKKGKSLSVNIPIENKLDAEGVKLIIVRTKSRFERFEREQEGTEMIIEVLNEQLGLKIEYNPQSGILILPKGTFVKDLEGGSTLVGFGKFAAKVESLQGKYGILPDDIILDSMNLIGQVIETFSSGNQIAISDEDGTILDSWDTLQKLFHHVNRDMELNTFND